MGADKQKGRRKEGKVERLVVRAEGVVKVDADKENGEERKVRWESW